jgi:putative redox protein
MYAERKAWNLGSIDVKLRLVKKDEDAVRIERTIGVSEAMTAEQQAKLLEIADKTPVSRAVAAGVPIDTVFI